MVFGLIIQRRSHIPSGGGRNAPEWVAGINRNARPEWIGTAVRNQPESVSGMARNTQGKDHSFFNFLRTDEISVLRVRNKID